MKFDYAALEAAGFTRVEIQYNGAGDEGHIEDIVTEPEGELAYRSELWDSLRDAAYAVLEEQHGGWEINEGSVGTITVLVDEQRALLNHGERYENVRYFQSEVR